MINNEKKKKWDTPILKFPQQHIMSMKTKKRYSGGLAAPGTGTGLGEDF